MKKLFLLLSPVLTFVTIGAPHALAVTNLPTIGVVDDTRRETINGVDYLVIELKKEKGIDHRDLDDDDYPSFDDIEDLARGYVTDDYRLDHKVNADDDENIPDEIFIEKKFVEHTPKDDEIIVATDHVLSIHDEVGTLMEAYVRGDFDGSDDDVKLEYNDSTIRLRPGSASCSGVFTNCNADVRVKVDSESVTLDPEEDDDIREGSVDKVSLLESKQSKNSNGDITQSFRIFFEFVPSPYYHQPGDNQNDVTFSDIANSQYRDAIESLARIGAINGFSDGTFRPTQLVNRADAVKIIVASGFTQSEISACNVYGLNLNDVNPNDWYAPYVCVAKHYGIVSGYADGTFRAANTITVAEAAKILSVANGVALQQVSGDWYAPYLNAMSRINAIPYGSPAPFYVLGRGEFAFMMNQAMMATGRTGMNGNAL